MEALKRGRATDAAFQAFVVPVAWKLVFERDVEAELLDECAYVEARLRIEPGEGLSLPMRVYRLYETLLERDETDLDIEAGPAKTFADRHGLLVDAICRKLAELLALDKPPPEPTDLLRLARRKLREAKTDPAAPQIKSAIDRLALNSEARRLRFRERDGDAGGTGRAHQAHPQRLLQRHDARHCQSLRTAPGRPAHRDHPCARRRSRCMSSRVRSKTRSPLLRGRMQEALDGINGVLKAGGRFRTYKNPFYPA